MKFIEKTTLIIFSCIMLIISIIAILLIFGWLELSMITTAVNSILNSTVSSNIVLGVSILFILLSIKCIFFDSGDPNGTRDGILLENEDGKLLISRDTIENLVSGVAKGFESTQNVTTKVILDKENTVKVFINLYVKQDVIIKELSLNLQQKIKEAIKRATDLEVKEVFIKVKNIATPRKTEETSE